MVQLRLQPGGAGAADAALLVLAAGDGERHTVRALLRADGELDGVPDQRAVRGVPDEEGAGEGGLQEPCHPVVRGPRRPARQALEERRPPLQLHLPPLRLRHPAHRVRKQHLLHQRQPGQEDVDVHLRRLLRHHGVHPLLPQLQDLVLPRPPHDHLHRMVPHRRRARPWQGGGSDALGAKQDGAVLHWRHEHTLHLWRACCHSGDNARDVEASEVQAHLPGGDTVRADADAAVRLRHVLGLRRHAARPLQRLLPPPEVRLPRRRRRPHAHPPVHHVRVRVHAALLRVGEGDRDARDEQRVQEGAREAAGGDPHLVPGRHLPLLRTHQLHRRLPPRQLHRLHHPLAGPHGHLRAGARQGERRRAAAAGARWLARNVRRELLRGGLGARRRLRLRRLGQHGQLRPAGRHLRPVHQVLPVPAQALASFLLPTYLPT